MTPTLTPEQIRQLPAVLSVAQAAAVMGLSLTTARTLVRTGDWPSPVLRLGAQYRIPTAPLLAALGMEPTQPLERSPNTEPTSSAARAEGRAARSRACRLAVP